MILLTFQKGPNGTHQLVAALNGRSMSPNQEMAETTANLVTLEKPFEDNDVSADSSSQHQLCKDTILYFIFLCNIGNTIQSKELFHHSLICFCAPLKIFLSHRSQPGIKPTTRRTTAL